MADLSRSLGEIMESPLISVDIGSTVGEALALARDSHVHHLPIRDGDVLTGFTCVCDLVDQPLDLRIEEIMKSPRSLTIKETALAAATLMKKTGVGSVIVTDDEEACGIVTRGTVVAWAAEADAVLSDQRCECCGLSEHLRHLEGRLLCAFCRGGQTEAEWWQGIPLPG